MTLDMQRIRLTDDHTLETASEVMQSLHFDQRIPNGRESYIKLLEDLDFRSSQDGDSEERCTQFVFQGQCMILGDARVGKTSLKNSLTGQAFDAEEPRSKGVEVSLVDQKWRNLDATTGLSFGSFARFSESVRYECALYGAGGIEFVISEDFTSLFSAGRLLFRSFGIISWIITFMWLLSVTAMSFSFRVFSFGTFFMAILAHFINFEEPDGLRVLYMIVTIPRFIVGLGTAYLLTGILKGVECSNLQFSRSEENDSSGNHYIWVTHLVIFAAFFHYISFYTMFLLGKHYLNLGNWSGNVESTVPGQVIFRDSVPLLPRISFFILPVVGGFSFGCVIGLSTEIPDVKYCNIIHLTTILTLCIILYTFRGTLSSFFDRQGVVALVLLLYISIEKAAVSLSSFCPLSVYIVVFTAWTFRTLYNDWVDMYFLFTSIGNVRETRASFTLIWIEKVMLNFQKLKVALHDKFSSIKLNLLDFAGDEEYYAYHHIFMRDSSIYIVVFNLANFADNNFRNIETNIRRLRFWLESICSQAAPKTPIFLVGTHRGHMNKNCLKTMNKHLQQHLMQSFSDELVMNKQDNLLYFPTENTLGRKDKGIQNLQKEIMSTAEELRPHMGREIPYSWIKIQDAIINLRKQSKNVKFCVPLSQFPVSVGNYICSNWTKETLKYFHEKGLVIYSCVREDSELSKWILLRPSILVDIIIQLVTPPANEEVLLPRGFRRDWKLLHGTGMLTQALLDKILSRLPENAKVMKGFLEEYDIICPLFFNVLTNKEEEAHVTHFVPSLLPLSTAESPVWFDGYDDKKFFVFFNRFLPEPLFQHLLSRAHRNSKADFPLGQPVIYKDDGRFWLRPRQPYRLLQLKDKEMIEVTFTYKSEGKEMTPSDVLSHIYSMVSGICAQHFPYVRFHCGPLCPSERCRGHQGDYISHPGVQQTYSRPHVFNVLPARQQAQMSSFYCVNQNFEEQFREWDRFE